MSFFYRKLVLVFYFGLINVLFCLPGSAFPKKSWLDAVWFDKWVHVGIFFLLCYGVAWLYKQKSKRFLYTLFGAAVIYGLAVEIVQQKWVPNRSFDLGDLIADAAGATLGPWAWRLKNGGVIKK